VSELSYMGEKQGDEDGSHAKGDGGGASAGNSPYPVLAVIGGHTPTMIRRTVERCSPVLWRPEAADVAKADLARRSTENGAGKPSRSRSFCQSLAAREGTPTVLRTVAHPRTAPPSTPLPLRNQMHRSIPVALTATLLLACTVNNEGEDSDSRADELTALPWLACTGSGARTVPNYSGTYLIADDACTLHGKSVSKGSKVTLAQDARRCDTVSVGGAITTTTRSCRPSPDGHPCDPYDYCAIALGNCEIYGGESYGPGEEGIRKCKAAQYGPGGYCSGSGTDFIETTTSEKFAFDLRRIAFSNGLTGTKVNMPGSTPSLCTLRRAP